MSYPYRNTYRLDNDTFVEDRGYAHTVKRGEANFATLEKEFSTVPVGSTAVRGMNGEGWQVVGGCPFVAAYAERLAKSVREERDRRIAATDYLMAVDYPITEEQRTPWKVYRQALRDVPGMDGFPWDGGGQATPWPVMPETIPMHA